MIFDRIAEATFWLERLGFHQVDVFGQQFQHDDGRKANINPNSCHTGFSPCKVSFDPTREPAT